MVTTRHRHAHNMARTAESVAFARGSRPALWLGMNVRPRLWLVLCAALLLALLGVPTATTDAQTPEATLAIGDNAIFLTGSRPPSDPNDLNFSGYVEIPYSAALNPSGGQLTIEAWVKRNETNRNETLVGNGWKTAYWLGFSSSGKLRFTPYGDRGLVDSNSVVPAGVWTHVAVTYDGLNRRFYIDGVLDKATTEKPGALVGAGTGEALGIGFDRDDFNPNYFGGSIDTVRIWNVARNGADIQATLFQSFGTPTSGLLAEWPFDGTYQDTAGGHNGAAVDNVQFTNDGAIPHDIRIPQVSVTPTLNGTCSDAAYASATQVTVDGTPVWLMHTADDLWICFDGLDNANTSASVYLDPNYTRNDPAQAEHLWLSIDQNDVKTAHEGVGDGAYTDTNAADTLWDADYNPGSGEFPTRRAEFRISADLLGGWSHVIGLALAKSTGLRGGTDLWPALAASNLPSTWSSATLGGIGPQRSFSGSVVYQPPDDKAPATGVAGVVVKLVGHDPGGSEAVAAMAKSSPSGTFSLTTNDDFAEHRLELGAPPKGYRVESAAADSPGVVVDLRTVDYGAAGGGAYPNNVFTLGDIAPGIFDATLGPYFLIIAPQAVIDDGALDEFVDFKRRIGFTVSVVSVEQIDATTAGANRRDRIRNYEKGIWGAIGLRFQYVLLIGTNAEIPYAYFTEWFNGYVTESGKDNPVEDLTGCLADPMAKIDLNAKNVKLKRSEWYYADLASNFDTNGNGCLVDGTASRPEDRAPGYTPDTRPTFNAMVAVGRIPLANPAAVRTALRNSMRFEQQSEAFKLRTVLAMSQVFLKGQYWTPKDNTNGMSKPCPLADADKEDTTVDKNCQGATTDAAFLGERMRADFLNVLGYQSTIFYEPAKPEGASPVQSPKPLTIANLKDELPGEGFVNIAGHGGPGGVARTYWANSNSNNLVDSPTEPLPFTSVDEASGAELLYTTSFYGLSPANGRAPVYMAAACSTLSPTDTNNIGAYALSQGHAVAWFGALNMINVGPWTQPTGVNALTVDYKIAQQLFGNHMRLGDALWLTLDELGTVKGSGSADVSFALYGDPTLSYWGNPGGQTTLAAWPMLRYDGRGIGYTTLAGPEVPKKLWEYGGTSSPNALRSPVLSNNGEVVVAHGSFVDVLRQGQLHQRLTLDGPAFGSPALAADGTIYAVDTSGRLYAFPYQSYLLHPILIGFDIPLAQAGGAPGSPDAVNALGERYRRWRVELGGAAQTSPIVGADGMIAVGADGKVILVRPDGLKLKERSVPGQAIAALTADAERNVYVATTDGYAGRINFFYPNCPGGICVWDQQGPAYSTPPLLARGAIYVGRADGIVVKLDKTNMAVAASFQADSRITGGPIAGPAGQVLVGTQNGTLYSLTDDLGLRWQRSIGTTVNGMPAFSSDALYVVAGNILRAHNPFSGAPVWSRNLGSVGDGSVAVGYGRELAMQTTGGAVLAYGEGWTNQIIALSARAIAADNRPVGIKLQWYTQVPPIGMASASSFAATGDLLVQRRSGDGSWVDLVILAAGTTEYVDTSAQPGETYAYRVQVLDEDGNHSEFVETPVDVQSAPPVPQAPAWEEITTTGAESLALDWSSPDGDLVTAYRVERGESAAGSFVPVAFTGSAATSLVDADLSAGTTYHFRIFALNGTGESPPSDVQAGTTRSMNLPAPEDVFVAVLEDGRIRLKWAGAPAQAQAEIQISQGLQDGYIAQATVDADDAAYDHFPGEGDVYIFRVKFVRGEDESPWAESNAVTFASILPNIYLPTIRNE